MPRLAAAVVAMMAIAGLGSARAQDYPTRTVTVIVPFAAGGPADITGRIVAEIFSRHLGQKFVVENVGGAGGTTGVLAAARAAAEGSPVVPGQLRTHALEPRASVSTRAPTRGRRHPTPTWPRIRRSIWSRLG